MKPDIETQKQALADIAKELREKADVANSEWTRYQLRDVAAGIDRLVGCLRMVETNIEPESTAS
jgi:hypothetical protein